MATPEFSRLNDEVLRSRLVQLRDAVKPILEGNYLSSFTDHTISHSDYLCGLVDKLAQPLSDCSRLSSQEAFVLYAGCYLHDVGLQNEHADLTPTIQDVMRQPEFHGRQWGDLASETRKEIVRREHHRISGDMVTQSIDASDPTLGITLTQDWQPGQIRALCVAHCLETGTDEYSHLTKDWGVFRMGLLSALLRLADICDESRRRSKLYLERTRELDLEARSHWWRHYYVADIELRPGPQGIVIWFDFPADRRSQYRELFCAGEIPEITTEFGHHRSLLASHGLYWMVRSAETPEAQCTTRPMDNDLERYLAEKVASRRKEQAEQDQRLALGRLKEGRPSIQRSVSELRSRVATISAAEQLSEFTKLAVHLCRLGGRREAWTMLWGEYNRLSQMVPVKDRLEAAVKLTELMAEDGSSEYAFRILYRLQNDATALQDDTELQYRFFLALGRSQADMLAFADAADALARAAKLAPDEKVRMTIEAEIYEVCMLRGDFAQLPRTAIRGQSE